MANAVIMLENGLFSGASGRYIESVEPRYAVVNGWICHIKEDGVIECNVARKRSDGIHSMRYTIKPNGFSKLTLKIPHHKVQTLRIGFVVSKGSRVRDGIIGLSGGQIEDRDTYFRQI